MNQLAKNNSKFSPFNCIAMKDVKDKNSDKGDVRPLFECVTAIDDAISKLHNYLDGSQIETDKINAYVKTLTDIQMDILSVCQAQIAKKNEYIPKNNFEEGPDGQDGAVGVPMQQTPEPTMLSEKAPKTKVKI
jgi:hypothetical protein